MKKTTEQDSNHNHLEKMNTLSLLQGINQEDKSVATAVEQIIPLLELLIDSIYS